MNPEEKAIKFIKYLVIILIVIVTIYIIWSTVLFFVNNYKLDERAQIGDSFNVLNVFFSGLAFIGIIYSIIIQNNAFKVQRNELKLQHQEMINSRYEFSFNRMTNLVNNQLNRLDNEIESFHFKGIPLNINYQKTGLNLIEVFNNNLNVFIVFNRNLKSFGTTDLDTKESYKQLDYILNNYDTLNPFITKIYTNIVSLRNIIEKEYIEDIDKQDLKNLFFFNIDLEVLALISRLQYILNIEVIDSNQNYSNIIDTKSNYIKLRLLRDYINNIQTYIDSKY